MDARPLVTVSPADEVIRSLRAWPDGELLDLGKAVGLELVRRGLPEPVALPIAEVLGAIAGVTVPA